MYYDLLAKIKNAGRAKKESLLTPFSKMDLAVAKVLIEAGYLKHAEKKTVGRKNFLEIKITYKNKRPIFEDFKLISKPSRRIYTDYRALKPVRQGYGLGVVSTSRGVMSEKAARKNKVGGEYLFQMW